jgi:hypothetical protein
MAAKPKKLQYVDSYELRHHKDWFPAVRKPIRGGAYKR